MYPLDQFLRDSFSPGREYVYVIILSQVSPRAFRGCISGWHSADLKKNLRVYCTRAFFCACVPFLFMYVCMHVCVCVCACMCARCTMWPSRWVPFLFTVIYIYICMYVREIKLAFSLRSSFSFGFCPCPPHFCCSFSLRPFVVVVDRDQRHGENK